MWPASEPWLSLLVTAAAWLWGSFLNLAVDRAPPRGAPAAGAARLTLLRPARSLCLTCGRPVPWHDNVPVLSWLWLRGRCRTCGAPIGARTLAVEAAAPLLALGWHLAARTGGLGPAFEAWGYAALSWLLVAAPLAAERRRFTPAFLALGVLIAAAAGVGVLAAALAGP